MSWPWATRDPRVPGATDRAGFPIWTGRYLLGQGLVRRKRKGGEGTHSLLMSVPAAASGAAPRADGLRCCGLCWQESRKLRDGRDHAWEVMERVKALDQSVHVLRRAPPELTGQLFARARGAEPLGASPAHACRGEHPKSHLQSLAAGCRTGRLRQNHCPGSSGNREEEVTARNKV